MGLQKQILELINSLGATERVPAVGSRLDGQWQEVISTIETTDPQKHLTVAAYVGAFQFADRLCPAASVQVFRYTTETHTQTKEK